VESAVDTQRQRRPLLSRWHDGLAKSYSGPDRFEVHIPLDSAEAGAVARRYLAKLEASMTPEQKKQITQDAWERGLARLQQLVYKHRVGHFQVDCRVLDGSRVMGADVVELEVLFKGHFSDVRLPGSPPV
jgi:hypothetical protein